LARPPQNLAGGVGEGPLLIQGAIIRSASSHAGVEETSAAVLTIFLNGARSSPS
jgi:hypothetical protein